MSRSIHGVVIMTSSALLTYLFIYLFIYSVIAVCEIFLYVHIYPRKYDTMNQLVAQEKHNLLWLAWIGNFTRITLRFSYSSMTYFKDGVSKQPLKCGNG